MYSHMLLAALGLASFSSAAPAAFSNKALYFLDNDPAGANLAAVAMAANGSLYAPTLTPTGGKGLHEINSTSNMPLGPDSLSNQGAVEAVGEYVFTVNPGSNSVVMFWVPPTDPTHPVMVGQPVDSMGEVPVSVTYSPELSMACVLNAGAKSGIACYKVTESGLVPVDSKARPLAPFYNATTPPLGPGKTASQIKFSPNSKVLMADVKGGAAPNSTELGTVFVYPVQNGRVMQNATTTQIPGMTGNWGFTFLGDDRVFMSDIVIGGALLSMGSDYKLSMLANTSSAMKNYSAPCWSAWSPPLGTAYVIDAGMPHMAAVDIASGNISHWVDVNPSLMGLFDTVVDGTKAYFLAATAMIGEVDLVSGKMTQSFGGFGMDFPNRTNWQGLAMYGKTLY